MPGGRCRSCHGTGRCYYCDGSGKSLTGRCVLCFGSGICERCGARRRSADPIFDWLCESYSTPSRRPTLLGLLPSPRTHDFFIVPHRRPHDFLFLVRTQRPHPIRTSPSPSMRRRTSIRMPVVAQPIRASRRPFGLAPVNRTQTWLLRSMPGVCFEHVDDQTNRTEHKHARQIAPRIAVPKSRLSFDFLLVSPARQIRTYSNSFITRAIFPNRSSTFANTVPPANAPSPFRTPADIPVKISIPSSIFATGQM